MPDETFSNMIGRTMATVTGAVGDESMVFTADDGAVFKFFHSQDCCESVQIEDIAGDLPDLVGSAILQAELSTQEGGEPVPEYAESYTWSFYKFRTHKGDVTVRWLGTSNGYYGETVRYSEHLP